MSKNIYDFARDDKINYIYVRPKIYLNDNIKNMILKKNILVIASGNYFFDVCGFLNTLKINDILPDFKFVIGSQMGALGCLLYLSIPKGGATTKNYIENFIKNFINQNPRYSFVNKKFLGTFSILKNGYYTNNTKAKQKLINNILKEGFNNKNINFDDLYVKTKKIYIISITEFISGQIVYASYYTTPYLSVSDAVNATTNIQGIFEPIYLPIPKLNSGYYYDGSVSDQYPIDTIMKSCSKNYYGNYIINKNIDLEIINDPKYVFGIKYNDITSSTNPYTNVNFEEIKPNDKINIFKLIKITNNTLIINEPVFLTDKWLAVTAEIYDNIIRNYYSIMNKQDMIKYYNNGCKYAVSSINNFNQSKGLYFNS